MISTHILDTSKGHPAANVKVRLAIESAGKWQEISVGETNADGRFVFDCDKKAGVYQITFEIEPYFAQSGGDFFFQNTPVIFKVENTQRKYHVPLLLNPYGYSTYRGS